MPAAFWNRLINCCPFFIDVSTIVSFCSCQLLFWCSHLFTATLSFLGSFSAFWDAIDIDRSISIAFQLCQLFVASLTVEGVLFFLTIQWFADTCHQPLFGPLLSSSLFSFPSFPGSFKGMQ